MRKYYVLFIFGISLIASSQTKITFNYDAAGNQIKRELCITCTSRKTEDIPKEIEALVDDDLLKFSSNDIITYYPNPVKEELYIKWELINGNNVSSIQVYAMNGQVLRTFNKLENINSQNIAFQDYPVGIYIVTLFYINGDQKAIKIIKQ